MIHKYQVSSLVFDVFMVMEYGIAGEPRFSRIAAKEVRGGLFESIPE